MVCQYRKTDCGTFKSWSTWQRVSRDILYMFSHTAGNYVCIHCGSANKYLMKTYTPTVLDLINCANCGNIADKYLEYDEVIILIDIILFNKQAYRHVLFNTKFQNHWKLALLILMVKTAGEWLCIGSTSSICLTMTSYEHAIYALCFKFVITILGELLFFCIVSGFFTFFWDIPPNKSAFIQQIMIIWKAIISSSFGYFLLLPSLIWNDFQREIHLLFICVYTLLSHIQALTVVFKIERPLLAGILIMAGLANYLFCTFLRWILQTKYNINIS